MNWVQKFYEMQMSELENPTVKKNPLFIDGITVTTPDSDCEVLVYQEPFSDIVAMTVYDEDRKELYTNRMTFRKEKNDWIILPKKLIEDKQKLNEEQQIVLDWLIEKTGKTSMIVTIALLNDCIMNKGEGGITESIKQAYLFFTKKQEAEVLQAFAEWGLRG